MLDFTMHKRKTVFMATCFMGLTFLPIAALAQDATDFSSYLTGDTGGIRSKLLSHGIDVQAVYTADVHHNMSGGIKHGNMFMDNLDLTAEIDGEKLFGADGLTLFFYALNNNGGKFNEKYVGSHEGVDNIEVSEPAAKLYEAWAEQSFFNDRVTIRAGLYDLNSEFDVTDSSGIFLNPTYGIDTAYAATGENGPSIFPTTSLAARINITPTENTYLRAAILDGVAGDPENPEGTQIHLRDEDGILLALEGGYGTLETGRIGVGGWWYSEKSDHYTDTNENGDPAQENSNGFYALAEKTLFHPYGDETRSIDGFIRFATADDSVTQFDYSGAIGLTYTKPFASRPDDIAGITVHGVHNGDLYRESVASTEPALSGEWGIEATYSFQATPWLRIQPDIQYIKNPGTVSEIDDAFVTSLRLELSL